MLMSSAKQKTAKRLLGIVNATVKRSMKECALGEKQTEKKLGSNLVSGATENWQTPVQRKKQQSVLLNPQRQSETKIGAGTKCLLLMAATDVPVVLKQNACFCR